MAAGLTDGVSIRQLAFRITHRSSTSLMYAENTRAFISALPAANSTLFGCQSIESTVDLIGFLSNFDTHQLFSESKEQMAMALETNEDLDAA